MILLRKCNQRVCSIKSSRLCLTDPCLTRSFNVPRHRTCLFHGLSKHSCVLNFVDSQHVSAQYRIVVEGGRALFTRVRPVSCVCPHVTDKCSSLSECLFTEQTAVWSFRLVDVEMDAKSLPLAKSLAAFLTDEVA